MPILIALLLAITISILYLYVYSIRHKKTPLADPNENNQYSHALDISQPSNNHQQIAEGGSKSYEEMSDAIQKAQEILSNTAIQSQKFEEKLEQELTESTTSSKELFSKELKEFSTKIASAEAEYLKYLEDLKKASLQVQENSLETVKSQVGQLFLKFEQNLSDFLSETEQKSTQSIELELQTTRQLIDTYKTQQLKLIDENIIAMLEKTLSLVLPQKLSLKDQTELVYDALEKAKSEKLLV